MKYKKKEIISYRDIYLNPIIGYDSKFWDHCMETDKDEITQYPQNDKLHRLAFKCDKNHTFTITPNDFFNARYYCPVCIYANDRGAINCDPEISLYYSDNRYPLEEISEFSPIEYQFTCPNCSCVFYSTMAELIHKHRKCPKCIESLDFTGFNAKVESGFNYISFD